MRAYHLSNNDVVIDVRPYANGTKPLLRCIKVWCHKRKTYCFKAIVTNRHIVRRLNPSETAVVHKQLGIAIATGQGIIVPEAFEEEPWYNRLKNAMPETVKEMLP